MKQNENKKLNKTNVKRIALGTVGVITTAGAVFGITTLVSTKESQTNYIKASSNASNDSFPWTPIQPTQNKPTSDMSELLTSSQINWIDANPNTTPSKIVVKNPLGSFEQYTSLAGKAERLFKNNISKHIADVLSPSSFTAFIGDINKPRLVFNAEATNIGSVLYQKTINESLQDFIDLKNSSNIRLDSNQILINYVIEGQEGYPIAVDKNLPYIDLDLSTWLTSHPLVNGSGKLPKVTFYIAIKNDSIKPDLNLKGADNLVNAKIEIKSDDYHPRSNVDNSYQGATTSSAWSFVREHIETFDPKNLPSISFDANGNLTISETAIDSSKHYEIKYSFSNLTTLLTKAEIDKMTKEEIYNGRQSLTAHVIPDPGYMFAPTDLLNLPNIELGLAEHDINPGTWYTPQAAMQILKTTDFPFPDFATEADIPMPTFENVDSKNYSLKDTYHFGVDYELALSDGSKWDGVKTKITLAEFIALENKKELPNLYDYKTGNWKSILCVATAKSTTSQAKTRTETFSVKSGSTGIITANDFGGLQAFQSAVLSTSSLTDSAHLTMTEHAPASIFDVLYSTDNGATWITKAELEKFNLFDPTKHAWYRRYTLQKVVIKQGLNINFDASIAATNFVASDHPNVDMLGITDKNNTTKEFISVIDHGPTSLILPDAFKPKISAGSTSGDWKFGSFMFPTITPNIEWEFTFDNDFSNAAHIYKFDAASKTYKNSANDILTNENLWDFEHNQLRQILYRISPATQLPHTYFGVYPTSSPIVDGVTYAPVQAQLDLSSITPTIAKNDVLNSPLYANLIPQVTGTSSEYVISSPTNSLGLEYKYKLEGEATYVDLTTFMKDPNHKELFNFASGKLIKVFAEITSTTNLEFTDGTTSSKTISDIDLPLTNIAIAPRIMDGQSTDKWVFGTISGSSFKYEFTFDDNWNNPLNIFTLGHGDHNLDTSLFWTPDYKFLNEQNLYDFATGKMRTLHWRISNPTPNMGRSEGEVAIPSDIKIQIDIDKLRALFPITTSSGTVSGNRFDPQISKFANNYILRDGEAFGTSNNFIPDLDLQFRLESESDSAYVNAADFQARHKDITDFTTGQILPIVWRVVSTNANVVVTGNAKDIHLDATAVTPTTRIHVLPLESNIGKVVDDHGTQHLTTSDLLTVGFAAGQPRSDLLDIYVATNLDENVNGVLSWRPLSEALADWSNFLPESRNGSVLKTLYWKVDVHSGKMDGFEVDKTNVGANGEMGTIDLLPLRFKTHSAPSIPSLMTSSTTQAGLASSPFQFDIKSDVQFIFEFRLEGDQDYFSPDEFFKHYSQDDLWAASLAHKKVEWDVSLAPKFVYDPAAPKPAVTGSFDIVTGATEITTLVAPTLNYLTPSDRPGAQYYSDKYDITEDASNLHMKLEYSMNSVDWLSKSDFIKKYPNMWEQRSNGGVGRTIYWRATSDDGAYFSDSLKGKDTGALNFEPSIDVNGTQVKVLKVVSFELPIWRPGDTVTAYNLRTGLETGTAIISYSDDRVGTYVSAGEFMKTHKPLLYEDPVTHELKVYQIFWKATPEDGFFFEKGVEDASHINTGGFMIEGYELPVPSSASPTEPVNANGTMIFPIGWVHYVPDDVWLSKDGKVIFAKDPVTGIFAEITSPTQTPTTTYFPKEWTHDVSTDKWSSPDGKENWVKDSADQTGRKYILEEVGSGKSDSMPIWEIAVIAAGGALTLGVGGFFLYRFIKRKKMDY